MGKRGASQIDWILSLGLFLLYVGWFFAFIAPNISFVANKNSLMIILQNNFDNEFNHEIKRFPLFIEYNETSSQKSIVLNYTSNVTNIRFLNGNNYIIWNNKLIFLANITQETETFWIIEAAPETTYEVWGLNSEEDWASTENLSVEFNNKLLKKATFKQNTWIEDSDYYLNEEDLTPIQTNYTDKGFVAIYESSTGNINHTSLIFANNQEIYNFITLEQESDVRLKINFELGLFDAYYADNNNYGNFGSQDEVHYADFSYDYITLYTETESLSMFFDNDVDFNFTYYNDTLDLEMTIPISNDYEYRYVFHDGNFTDILREDYSSRFGVIETLEGVDLDSINTNYTYLKTEWRFPNNFYISIYDNTSKHIDQEEPIFQIGSYRPGNKNVFAETKDMFKLTDEGDYEPISINYRIW